MTKPMIDLTEPVEKSGDADLLREMIGFAAERATELEAGGQTGAGYGRKFPERLAQRKGLSYDFPRLPCDKGAADWEDVRRRDAVGAESRRGAGIAHRYDTVLAIPCGASGPRT